MIEMCIQCHNFQRRLIWLLSSLVEQTCDMNKVLITISSTYKNGDPTTEEIVKYFLSKGLNIRLRIFDDLKIFAKRGLVRNIDVSDSECEWLFFADADNVYHPLFFKSIFRQIKRGKLKNIGCYTAVKKSHTDVTITNKIMDKTELTVIENAFQKIYELPTIGKSNKSVAAGCMQLVKREWLNGKYLRRRTRDYNMFTQGQRANSDKQFRRRLKGTKHLRLPLYIHLNHFRDKEVGYHIKDQR